MIQTIDIETLPISPGVRAGSYRVWHNGAVLIEHTRDPEFAACRALLAAGVTGALQTRHKGSATISFVLDIEAGAASSTSDPDGARIRVGKWQPRDMAGPSPDKPSIAGSPDPQKWGCPGGDLGKGSQNEQTTLWSGPRQPGVDLPKTDGGRP